MTHRCVVQIVGLNADIPCDLDGRWLLEYDPRRPGMSPTGVPLSAHLETTADRSQAKVFGGLREAVEYCRQTSGGTRPDSKPDRPLTAFHLAYEPATEGEAL